MSEENSQITLAEENNPIESESPISRQSTIAQAFESAIEKQDKTNRDEAGKFKKADASAQIDPPPVQTAKPRPSSWKKDYEEHWGKLDPALQDYIIKRESDFASGVSTYKQEADRAKELNDALAPFLSDLEAHKIKPTDWITNLGYAHKVIAMGTPEQKLQMFAKLANDYGVDLSALTGQNVNPQISHLVSRLNNIDQEWNAFKTTQQQMEEAQLQKLCSDFAAETEKHPHFEMVREQMAQLLEKGLANDLEEAYQKSIRLNDEAWTAEQARQQQLAEASRHKAVEGARRAAVSPKSATPSGAVKSGNKDRRSMLEETLSEVGARL